MRALSFGGEDSRPLGSRMRSEMAGGDPTYNQAGGSHHGCGNHWISLYAEYVRSTLCSSPCDCSSRIGCFGLESDTERKNVGAEPDASVGTSAARSTHYPLSLIGLAAHAAPESWLSRHRP